MKRTLALVVFACTLGAALSFAGCAVTTPDDTIVVGASPTPHAQILEVIKEDVEAAGYHLEIKQFDDYVTPNTALEEGSLDANYFQHTPYLETFNRDYGTHLSAVEKIHYEPFGVYGKEVTADSYASQKAGRTILVPNDGSNLTRALFLLQDEGYLTLREGVTPSDTLTENDIAESNGNEISPAEAQLLSQLLENSVPGTLAVINGNYALSAGLDVHNALATENATGDAALLYANIIAVKTGNETSEKTTVLKNALRSRKVYDYIVATYGGAVLPSFTV